jgi:predicted membrane protein
VRDMYKLGAGEMWIDLREVDFPVGETTVAVDLGIGEANVLVPPEVCVSTETDVGVGVVEWFGREDGGVEVDFERQAYEPGQPRLRIVSDIDIGALRVDDDPLDFEDHFRGFRGDRFDGPLEGFDRRQDCRETA